MCVENFKEPGLISTKSLFAILYIKGIYNNEIDEKTLKRTINKWVITEKVLKNTNREQSRRSVNFVITKWQTCA